MNDSTCISDGCTRKVNARGLCHKHYEYLRSRGELPAKPCKGCGRPLSGAKKYCSDECMPDCSVSGCANSAVCRGWCMFHYTRWSITGDPSSPLTRTKNQPGQLCSFRECVNSARKNGLCTSHDTQLRTGGELKPLAYKSKTRTCIFCGGPSGITKGFRKYCSANCQKLYYRHGPGIGETWACVLCAESFPFEVNGRRRTKANARMCNPCRRNSSKHGYSAAQLAKRDGSTCQLCFEIVDLTLRHPDLMRGSVDHIIPSSLGGSNEPDNVQLAHLHCNIKKNNRVDIVD